MLVLEWKKVDHTANLNLKDILWILLSSSVCLFFSGIDGLTTQTGDWMAHNQKFYDLFKNDWPTYFPEVGQYACYYFGHFLVPSFLCRVYGELLPSVLITWSLIGYVLGLSWLYLLLNKSMAAMIAMLFLRGTGHGAFVILKTFQFVDWLPPNIVPSVRSLLEQLKYSSNQLIPVLIVSGILLFDFIHKKRLEDSFFLITLLFVWAIFPAASMALFYFALLIHKYVFQQPATKLGFKELFVPLAIPALLLIPTLLYFLSSQSISSDLLLWDTPNKQKVILGYLTSMLVDLLLLFIVLTRLNKINPEFPQWLTNVLIAGLFIVSLFKIGKYNDLFFRSSMVFGMMIFILILRNLVSVHRSKKLSSLYSILPALLVLAVLSGVGIFANRRLLRDNKISNHYLGTRPFYKEYAYDQYPNMYQTIRYGSKEELAVNQYLVKKGSFFEKYLCKRPDTPTK
jgi:hypothetical protein